MNEKISLSELQLLIRDTLYLSLPQTFWIMAEISEINVNSSGHCYLELIEKNPDEKNIRARVKGIIWSSRFGFIRSFFENITGESLKNGLKILVKAKIEYHELYGLSLIINDIDPSFTLGEMTLKRQQIIKRLEQEGVFSMNRDLDFPLLPQKIAVISSKNAAGYTDFINHLTGNSYGYVFYTSLIETPMQGSETEQGIINALDKIALNPFSFDLVVIIRGGGSQTDLSWFDSYGIAYHITQFPLPVITGIGHDKDLSVTDLVANISLKTPTAVADHLIERMAAAENKLDEMSSEIRDLSRAIIEENRNLIETYSIKLLPLARIMISEIKEMMSGNIMSLIKTVRDRTSRSGLVSAKQLSRLYSASRSFIAGNNRAIETARHNLSTDTGNYINIHRTKLVVLENTLNILKPENVLRRGYTITSLNGKIVKKSKLLINGDIIETMFHDGSVSSKIADKKNGEKL